MYSTATFFLSFLGGILPALLWLSFWLREDKLDPEPRDLIIGTFSAGMVATLVALAIEDVLRSYVGDPSTTKIITESSVILIAVWATIEELCKYIAAYTVSLRRRENDEPIDNMIYLITAALGFAAIENALFLLDPIQNGQILQSLITGNMRFIGSTLLHLVSSSVIGIFMAFAFCAMPHIKKIYTIIGVLLAITLHTLFNLFIIKNASDIFAVFGFVWVGVIALLLFFERVKRTNKSCVY